ncbi:MAG: DUF2911 domain-containing protein [Bacteroidota bacterium]
MPDLTPPTQRSLSRWLAPCLFLIGLLAVGTASPASAQVAASEKAGAWQVVDGTRMEVEYSRPRLRNRPNPYGTMERWGMTWTPGAGNASTFTVDRPVTVLGEPLAAGTYSLWLVLRESEPWTLVMDPTAERFHLDPPDSTGVEGQLRADVTPETMPHTEALTWAFAEVQATGATLVMRWGPLGVRIPIEVEPSYPLTVAPETAAQVEGVYAFSRTEEIDGDGASPAAESTTFTLARRPGGALVGVWDPPLFGSMREVTLAEADSSRFLYTLTRRGEVWAVYENSPFTFDMSPSGSARGFTLQFGDNEFGRGVRQGPVPAGFLAQTDSAAAVRWNVLTRDLWLAARDNARLADYAPGTVEQRAVRRTLDRGLALAAAVAYDAAIAARDLAEADTLDGRRPTPEPVIRAAIASASAVVLGDQFADRLGDTKAQRLIDAALARDAAQAEQALGAERAEAALADGESVAARLLAWAEADGTDILWEGEVPTGPAMWTSAPGQEPDGPARAVWRPWAMTAPDQFRPPQPPTIGDRAFDAALEEVRQVVAARTEEQADLARRFANEPLNVTFHEAATDALVDARWAGEYESARVLALLGVAMYDANVACFDAKYHYWLLRPTHADDSISIAEGVRLPNFPAYPSGHACGAGAAAEIVGALVPRARPTVDAIADDAAMSRLYAGVHYRFDNDDGLALGREVAKWVLEMDVRKRLGAWRGAMTP